jgi:outer membrane protein OmpA-like peptidoglycan-associated protein
MASPTTAAAPAPEEAARDLVEAAAEDAAGVWTVERQRVRRPLGGLFWLAAVMLPLALTAGVALTRTPVLERTLHDRAVRALDQAGLGRVRVVVDGRQLLAKVPTGTRGKKVAATLTRVPGVQAVRTVPVYASKAEARACAHLQVKLDRATGHEAIPFEGGSTRLSGTGVRMVQAAARLLRACRPATVIVGGHTDPSTPNGSTISLFRARVLVKALRARGVAGRRLTARGYGDQFPLTQSATPAARARNERGSLQVEAR